MNKIIDLFKKHKELYLCIPIVILLIVLLIPINNTNIFKISNKSKIERICKLATVEAYYHNVASKEQTGFLTIGYKKYWVEYEGIVRFGIDASEVEIGKPSKDGKIIVKVPKAQIIGEPEVIKEKVKEPITDTGLFTNITGSDKTEAITDAQKNMKETAENDAELFVLARERAKRFLEDYITGIGKSSGKDYKVEFVDK
jgi:hypothetical protein